jgi:septum formation protein
VILASGSPQRKAILEQLGIPFTVQVAGVDELDSGDPVDVATTNALRKASHVASTAGSRSRGPEGQTELVLGVDTLVALDDRIYGKPGDEAEAHATLQALEGRTHTVVSGLALIRDGVPTVVHAETRVTFRVVGDEVLRWYVATGEWRGRAGAYAIQGKGAALVRGIEGDYLNVVGLPVGTLLDVAPDLLRAAR